MVSEELCIVKLVKKFLIPLSFSKVFLLRGRKGVSVQAYLGQRSTGEIKVCEAVIIVRSSQGEKEYEET